MPINSALALSRLTLTDFRNYAHMTLETGPEPVVLTGPNGAGKTNLLEAVSLLAPGRGLRAVPYGELARHGAGRGWAVAARLGAPDSEIRIGTAWTGGAAADGNGAENARGQSRQVQIDGVMQKSSGALARHVRMLWLTPAMDRLFAGPASDRRRFLDRLVIAFDAEHGARVQAFEKLMRERNRLLEGVRPDPDWLSSLESRMAEAAIAVAASRHTAIEALSALMSANAGADSPGGFPWGRLEIAGELEARIASGPAVEVEERYRSILRESRAADAAAGRTLSGPHRSDLRVVHGPKGTDARQCSTGEQKALLIGIILAHARAIAAALGGQAPVLLLDEVAAHLDETRRNGLFEALQALGVQAWMTGTDAGLFRAAAGQARFFEVRDGAVGSPVHQ